MDGVLNLAKPPGPTSHDVVALVRRLTGTRRVGHGGTLDPFASGVLPIFVGRATRLAEYHLGHGKRYRATICFGASSTTDDLDGELTPAPGPAPSRADVEAALPSFMGSFEQRPPAFSAISVGGRRAYDLARAGEMPELRPRAVTIDALDLVEWDGSDPARPVAIVDVVCSAGTYVRAIARDLGVAVGSAGYLCALVRTASGTFTLGRAVPLERLRVAAASGPDAVAALLEPIDAGLDDLPLVPLNPAEAAAIERGQFVRAAAPLPEPGPGGAYRLIAPDASLLAIAAIRDGRLAPDKVLRGGPPERPRPSAGNARGPRSGPQALRPARGRAHMRVVPGLAALTPAEGRLFVVVGVFDGLHLGHAYLLERLRDEARRLRARPVVITFDAHPEEILHGAAPPILVDPEERLQRLAEAGVAVTVVQHFDGALRMTPYDAFVRMITERTDLAGLLMTPDAAFGHERRGTPEALAALGARDGFEVVVVPPFEIGGHQVRSADIRAHIAAGDLEAARALLGRPFAVIGHRAASSDRPGSSEVTFPLPVALPPKADYAVEVAAFPPPAGTNPTDAIHTVAHVAGAPQRIVLEAAPLAGSRVRVAFTEAPVASGADRSFAAPEHD